MDAINNMLDNNHIPVLDVANPVRARKRGCFPVIALLPCSIEDNGKQISIQKSWLPIIEPTFNDAPQTLKRIDNVIPVLMDANGAINRIMPTALKYAREHEKRWTIIPVPFFYRPSILDYPLSNGQSIENIAQISDVAFFNGIRMEDRPMISFLSGATDPSGYRKVVEISQSILEEACIDPMFYGIDLQKNDRDLGQEYLAKFPFLVHHVFEKLQNLHLLKYTAMIYGGEESIMFIRYKPEYFHGIRNSKYLLDDISHVVT